MRTQTWSPAQYLKFETERTRPARDLLAQIAVSDPGRVVDVGCGPGNSTALLAGRWPDAEIVGFDTSETMLAESRSRLPSARFEYGDAATWLPQPGTGVVFANAVYQWIDGHIGHFARIVEALESGAVLAVQMPDNLMQPMHVISREVAARPRFAAVLTGVARDPLPPVAAYYDVLSARARRVDIWHTIYQHVMPDVGAIVEWVKGTGLGPFLQRLDAGEQAAFLEQYAAEVEAAYRPAADGRVLMAFPRLFLIAER